MSCGSAALAGDEEAILRRWVPPQSRVLVSLDRRTLVHQPDAATLLRLRELEARFATGRIGARAVRRFCVAFGADRDAPPLALSLGDPSLAAEAARVRGARVAMVAGNALYRAGDAMVMVDAGENCLLEGRRDDVAALVAPRAARWLDGIAMQDPRATMALAARPGWPVSVYYAAPDGGTDLHTILTDLDRMLQLGIGAALDTYERPLRLLGVVTAFRLDVKQAGGGLAGEFQLAMPNRMAAQIASVSLNAGREMARAGSEAAVRAGNMSAADAQVLGAILETLEAQAEGESVRVRVSIADSTGS